MTFALPLGEGDLRLEGPGKGVDVARPRHGRVSGATSPWVGAAISCCGEDKGVWNLGVLSYETSVASKVALVGRVGVPSRTLATSLPCLTINALIFSLCEFEQAFQYRSKAFLTSCLISTSALAFRDSRHRSLAWKTSLRLINSTLSCLMLTLSRSKAALLWICSISFLTSLCWFCPGR